jgi:hypothetical protein
LHQEIKIKNEPLRQNEKNKYSFYSDLVQKGGDRAEEEKEREMYRERIRELENTKNKLELKIQYQEDIIKFYKDKGIPLINRIVCQLCITGGTILITTHLKDIYSMEFGLGGILILTSSIFFEKSRKIIDKIRGYLSKYIHL